MTIRSPWLTTQSLSLTTKLLQKPSFSYAISGEKEDDAFAVGRWELTHRFTLSENWRPRQNISGSVNFSYSYDPNPEEDDIALERNLIPRRRVAAADRQHVIFGGGRTGEQTEQGER